MTEMFNKNNGFSNQSDKYAQNSERRENSGKRLFSKQLLYDLRNKIPIRHLIENVLEIGNHMDSGIFRFECPLCKSFHTSVKKDTNLARCFDCQVNFNTIEMVMKVRSTEFRQSAEFLTQILKGSVSTAFTRVKFEKVPKNSAISKSLSSGEPVDLGSVFSTLPELKMTNASPNWKLVDKRIQGLENEIEKLKSRMDAYYRFLIKEFSGRS